MSDKTLTVNVQTVISYRTVRKQVSSTRVRALVQDYQEIDRTLSKNETVNLTGIVNFLELTTTGVVKADLTTSGSSPTTISLNVKSKLILTPDAEISILLTNLGDENVDIRALIG